MKTTTMWRTQATETVTVSTVRIREGRSTWYETALIVDGRVSDSRRQPSKFDAGYEHDCAVAIVRGHYDLMRSNRAEFYSQALASLV